MRSLKVFVSLLLFAALAACSTQPKKVDCEAHLVPINPAGSVVKGPAETQP
jgi:hypothetical protein